MFRNQCNKKKNLSHAPTPSAVQKINMAHTLFDGLTGVSLDGDSSGLGVSEVRFDDAVPAITGIVPLDEEDIFQCGRCRKQFTSLPMFVSHKQQHASSSSSVCSTALSNLETKRTTLEVDSGGTETFDALSHLEQSDLVGETEVGQSIILSDEILFNIGSQVSDGQMLTPLEASTVRDVTSWEAAVEEAVEESMRIKLGDGETGPETTCLMPTSQVFEDALAATQQTVLEPPPLLLPDDSPKILPPPTQQQQQPNKVNKLQCQFCQKSFPKRFDLDQHVRSHTGEKPFQCVVCGRAFSQKSNVKKHMLTHKVWPKGRSRTLPEEPVQIESSAELEAPSAPEKSKPVRVIVDSSYVCQYCQAAFSCYFELKTHMKAHVEEKVYRCIQKNCNLTFNELNDFLEHTRSHESSSQYRCHACGKHFQSLGDLGSHHYDHTNAHGIGKPCAKQKPRDYSCSKCKSHFATPETLEHHLATTNHQFECNLCKKIFTCERYLRRHLQTHTTDSDGVACDVCGKTFRTENYLRLHRVIHSSEKPFSCAQCGAAFNRKDKLSRHRLTHEEIKRFKCPFRTPLGCEMAFNRKDKLNLHIMRHVNGSREPSTEETNLQKASGHGAQSSLLMNCPNCHAKLRRKQQQVCHKCQTPILRCRRVSEVEATSIRKTCRSSNKAKPLGGVRRDKNITGRKDMSTIEIVVVPITGSSQVVEQLRQTPYQQIQLTFEPPPPLTPLTLSEPPPLAIRPIAFNKRGDATLPKLLVLQDNKSKPKNLNTSDQVTDP